MPIQRTEETIGERLRRLRSERGLSQRGLAERGVSNAYISRLEIGDRVPSMKALRILAGKLGVTPEYLETGREVPATEARAMKLSEAELMLRLGEDVMAAEGLLGEVLEEALAAGDGRDAVRARMMLGQAAADRGDHEAAIAQLENAVGQPWVTPLLYPDVFATLGHSYISAGRGARAAADLFTRALDDLEALSPTNASSVVRFATYLSFALSDLGDLDGARAAINKGLRYTESADDAYTRIRLYWSNARLASIGGDQDLARLSIDRAIALLETTEDTAHLGRAHLLAAEIATADDDLAPAREHLDSAQRFIGPGSQRQDYAWLRVQRALVNARTGDAASAIDEATEAIEILGGDGDETLRGCGHWALGEAYTAAGATSAARTAFKQASDLIAPGSKYEQTFVERWSRLYPADIGADVR
jgi:transcriptional regulator with XRE-family HTH domain/predicted negative regulator of RcsB-dependent stress response